MRIAFVCLALLLAGCAAEPTPESLPGPKQNEVGVPYAQPSNTLRFAADDFEQTQTYDGTFPIPNLCFAQQCSGQVVQIDLTPQVPADAPAELALTLATTSCVEQRLVLVDAFIVRSGWNEDTLAAIVVREQAGTIHLELRHCSLLSVATPTGVPYEVEVRSAVRSSVLPQFLPVRLALQAGEQISLTGPGAGDVESFVIVPPGRDPLHLQRTTTFNVSADLPAGSYVVLVKGADTSLQGPNQTLDPVRIQTATGSPHAVASDQSTQWTAAVPGLPVWASLAIGSPEGHDDAAYAGNFELGILQASVVLASYAQNNCPAVCSIDGPGGYWRASTGTAFFGEDMRRGELTFHVDAGPMTGVESFEVIGYIAD